MAEGQLGFGATLSAALLRPKKLFEAVKAGRVRLGPWPATVYVVALIAAGAGSQIQRSEELGTGLLSSCLLWMGGALLLSPVSWYIDVAVTHAVAGLLGGKGGWDETKAAIGFGSAPRLLSVLPFVGPLFELWMLWCRLCGLRILHELKPWRVVVAAVGPVVAAISLGLAVRVVFVEAFKLPSSSMFPSQESGDHVFVNKAAYGWITKSAPARGEVVAFRYPDPDERAEPMDFIKRVIALPGDEVVFESGAPIINGWRVPRCALGKSHISSAVEEADYDVFVEFLEGRAYLVGNEAGRDEGKQGPYRVSSGEFWVVGDNRSNSSDSRAWVASKVLRAAQQGIEIDPEGGGVPFTNLKGRVSWIWLPIERFGIVAHASPVLPRALHALEPALARCLAGAPNRALSTPPARAQPG